MDQMEFFPPAYMQDAQSIWGTDCFEKNNGVAPTVYAGDGKRSARVGASAKLNQTTHYTLSTLSVALLLNYDHVKVIPEYWFNTVSQKKY